MSGKLERGFGMLNECRRTLKRPIRYTPSRVGDTDFGIPLDDALRCLGSGCLRVAPELVAPLMGRNNLLALLN